MINLSGFLGYLGLVLCFLQFLECVEEYKMMPYGVLYRNIKIVMGFCLLSINLCHDSSSYIASDEVQRIVPFTIFSARFCIVSICFKFSWDVLQNRISAYSRILQTYEKNIVSSDFLLSLWDTLFKIYKRLLAFLHI